MLDKGIFLKHDLLNDEEKLMTYKIKSIFLTYNGLISSIKSYSKAVKNNLSINNPYETQEPIIQNNIRIFFYRKKACKIYIMFY